MKILSIDPSGTGTTGICIINKKKNEKKDFIFLDYNDKDWKKHINFIKKLIKDNNPEIILYENTNYIHKKTKDGLDLFRFLGAIEFISKKKTFEVNVLKVKKMKKRLLDKKEHIENLNYLPGRGKGWIFKEKRINKHCLDSYIIYTLWERNN